MEPSLKQFALGERINSSPHAVVSSLPTMADVRAYEEKDLRVAEAMESGYPRFVEHVFVRDLKAHYIEKAGIEAVESALVKASHTVDLLAELIGSTFRSIEVEHGLLLIWLESETHVSAFKKYIQHTGCGVSSRQAEDLLLRYKKRTASYEEVLYEGDAKAAITDHLASQTNADPENILISASGMNAFYGAFKSIQTHQQERGRTHWLQLGWLYVDSGSILSKYLGEDETLEICHAATDIDAVVARIKECGSKLAAVVVECPSNPLIRSCDLATIAAAIKAQGGILLVDPTIASVYAVDVLPHADIVVTSLTKYAAHSADVMAGAVILNAESPYFTGLQSGIQSWCIPHYERDLARLASSLQTAPKVLASMQHNAQRLIEFFKKHPAVKEVHCAEGSNYQTIAKHADASVPLFSLVLKGSMERFYDTVTVMKGPSFGADSTLLCPFMYLAHYDLVTNEAGREKLRAAGIEPDLIRIAVGTEPYEALEAVFAPALEASLA